MVAAPPRVGELPVKVAEALALALTDCSPNDTFADVVQGSLFIAIRGRITGQGIQEAVGDVPVNVLILIFVVALPVDKAGDEIEVPGRIGIAAVERMA